MKKKLIVLFGTLALAVMPALYAAAQDMDEGKDMDEAPGWQAERPGGRMSKDAAAGKHGPDAQGEIKGARGRVGGPGGPGGQGEMRERAGGPGAMPEDEALAVIKKHDAAFAEKLTAFKTAAPGKYRMILMMGGKMLSGARFEADANMEKDAVRELSLEFDTKELGLKYDKAADSDKAAIKADLKAKVSELFDLRLKGQEMRVGRMEGDLAKLKKNLENRKVNKAKIVDERLGQLTGEGYGW